MVKYMKKIFIFVLCLILLCGCSKNYITEISINDLTKKIENKESFILYIGSSKCSHCKDYRPKLNDVVGEYKLTVYYIDVSKLKDKESNKLSKIVSYSGTPATAFIEDGEDLGIQTHIDGDVSKKQIISSFKNNGYIK